MLAFGTLLENEKNNMRAIASIASRLAPRMLWRHRLRSWGTEPSEPEIALVPSLCSRHLATADVGAYGGEYTMHAIPHSGACLMFEPNPERAEALRKVFLSSARIEQVALSHTGGSADLRIPKGGDARATIENANALSYAESVNTVRTPVKRLDDYAGHRFGFVKIDVEGHEEAVLRGATTILRRDKPSLLIEIEDRHNEGALERIRRMLKPLGYQGYFLLEQLRSLDEFDAATMQNPANIRGGERLGLYVNNFLFLTEPKHSAVVRWRPPAQGG